MKDSFLGALLALAAYSLMDSAGRWLQTKVNCRRGRHAPRLESTGLVCRHCAALVERS